VRLRHSTYKLWKIRQRMRSARVTLTKHAIGRFRRLPCTKTVAIASVARNGCYEGLEEREEAGR